MLNELQNEENDDRQPSSDNPATVSSFEWEGNNSISSSILVNDEKSTSISNTSQDPFVTKLLLELRCHCSPDEYVECIR